MTPEAGLWPLQTGSGTLPADSHVHSQWSWDALAGSMEGTCRRAVEIGLPAVAFTEHADFTPWSLGPLEKVPGEWRRLVSDDVLTPPALDLNGYKDCLGRCRERFPGLAVTFASDAHDPATLAAGFTEAAQMAEAAGFTASHGPYGPWGGNAIPAR
jgi:histidinol phosphatase-like PHP family hydrolase